MHSFDLSLLITQLRVNKKAWFVMRALALFGTRTLCMLQLVSIDYHLMRCLKARTHFIDFKCGQSTELIGNLYNIEGIKINHCTLYQNLMFLHVQILLFRGKINLFHN